MYDLIIDCPTMPDLYKREIDNAFKSITKAKLGQFVKNGEDPKEKKYTQLARSIAKINGEEIDELETQKIQFGYSFSW